MLQGIRDNKVHVTSISYEIKRLNNWLIEID